MRDGNHDLGVLFLFSFFSFLFLQMSNPPPHIDLYRPRINQPMVRAISNLKQLSAVSSYGTNKITSFFFAKAIKASTTFVV